MNDNDWATFCDLLDKIVDMPFPTWKEKAEELRANLDEVASSAMDEISNWWESTKEED